MLVELSAVDLQPSLTAGRQITGLQSFFSTSRVELVSPRQPYILKLILFFVFFLFSFLFSLNKIGVDKHAQVAGGRGQGT